MASEPTDGEASGVQRMRKVRLKLRFTRTPCNIWTSAPPTVPDSVIISENPIVSRYKPSRRPAPKTTSNKAIKDQSWHSSNIDAAPAVGFNATDVAKHNTKEDCWVVINGRIWDVTEWLNVHPGGSDIIAKFAGQDASVGYNSMHTPDLVASKLTYDKFKGHLHHKMPPAEEMKENMGAAPPITPGMEKIGSPMKPRPPVTPKMDIEVDAESSLSEKGPDDPMNRVSRPLKRPADYSLHMTHGWTINDGTYDPMPLSKRRKRDVPYPSFINYTYRSMNGLSSLQLSHNAPISLSALDIAIDHVWKSMPQEVRQYLHIPVPNGPALWGTCEKTAKTMYEKMNQKGYSSKDTQEVAHRGFANLKKRPWIIWPLWIEDQWGSDYVTVIWYSTAGGDKDDVFDQLVAYAIIDPRRSSDADADGRHHPIKCRKERIRDRLFEYWGKAGINAQNAKLMDIHCSPMPLHEATSGERCFDVVKTLIHQIIDWYTKGKKFCPKTTITSMQQWVNPYQQRVEMAGINAWILMASFDFNARIVVEAILPSTRTVVVANGKKRVLSNYDLAGPEDDQHIASWDYLLPADRKYTAPTKTEG
ncbi:hypothetical protein F4861DRAFT_338707 [Xylaria intraflava]|nr:hypothetical protein F4861DRAFT_338707 [Xylaria intraflava]